MNLAVSHTAWRSLKWLAPLLILALLAGTSLAAERLLIPTERKLPFYCVGLGHTDPASFPNNWVITAFYRPLDKVPSTFNLLDTLPTVIPESNTPLVEGFAIVKEDNPLLPPIQRELQNVPGESVPICFTPGDEWLAAADDGNLTVDELKGLSLVGWADFYQESFSPGVKRIAVASGVLEDGRPFLLHSVHTQGAYEVTVIFGK